MALYDGRFAPSPTGELHLGNLRTAMLAWLYARSRSARFLLRIEDLDVERSRATFERSQIADLRALGIDWDGEPQRQSTRTEHYRKALERLHAQGRTYRCWCTRAEIRAAASAPHGRQLPYPGTCRGAPPKPDSQPFAWRLDARRERVSFTDLEHGAQQGEADDCVLWRSDGAPAYNLAVVVDDAAQAVGEVVRGDDLLTSTARQVMLQRLLGISTPSYRHVPLLRDSDGARLAKRRGAAGLAGREESPEQTVGWMAWSVGLRRAPAPLSALELLADFNPQLPLRRVSASRGGTAL